MIQNDLEGTDTNLARQGHKSYSPQRLFSQPLLAQDGSGTVLFLLTTLTLVRVVPLAIPLEVASAHRPGTNRNLLDGFMEVFSMLAAPFRGIFKA